MKKNKKVDIHFQLDALNKITIAYIVNELFSNYNINLVDYKPTCGRTLMMTKKIFCTDHPDQKYAHQLGSFNARYEEEFDGDRFSEEMESLGICDFFEIFFKGYGFDVSRMMAKKLKEFPSCDIIFNNQLSADPFPCSLIQDPESGMTIRNFAGKILLQNKTMIVTDIEFLIVEKIREVKEGIFEVIK